MRLPVPLLVLLLLPGCLDAPPDVDDAADEDGAAAPPEHEGDFEPVAPAYEGEVWEVEDLNASTPYPRYRPEARCAEPQDLPPNTAFHWAHGAEVEAVAGRLAAVVGENVVRVEKDRHTVEPWSRDGPNRTEQDWEVVLEDGMVQGRRTLVPGLFLNHDANIVLAHPLPRGPDEDFDDTASRIVDALGVDGLVPLPERPGREGSHIGFYQEWNGLTIPYTMLGVREQEPNKNATAWVFIDLHTIYDFPENLTGIPHQLAVDVAREYMLCLGEGWLDVRPHLDLRPRAGRLAYGVLHTASDCTNQRYVIVDAATGAVLGVDRDATCHQ